MINANNMPTRYNNIKFKYISEISETTRNDLSLHLDEKNVWMRLAEVMQLRPEQIRTIASQQNRGSSPSDELIKLWGIRYNHWVIELFFLLKREKLFDAMIIIKNYVPVKYHVLIPHIVNIDGPVPSPSPVPASPYDPGMTVIPITEIDYAELVEATDNFSSATRLGAGGFAAVYRGNWKHTDVAIKVLRSTEMDLQQCLNELRFLNGCRHNNVVQLFGVSLQGEHKCLVYELMLGGTLQDRLYPKQDQLRLYWQQRLNISLAIARGLNYLHTFRDIPLIHGDIKPANILLTEHLVPKIADFGLARQGPNSINDCLEISRVIGTQPYLPPDFIKTRMLRTTVDSFSFGVMLLETFTGQKAYDSNRKPAQLSKFIIRYLYHPENPIEKLIGEGIAPVADEKEMCIEIIRLGAECIALLEPNRPQMEYVLKKLNAMYEMIKKRYAEPFQLNQTFH